MTPNSNHDNDINVWCDYLTDTNYPFADEIREEEAIPDPFYVDFGRNPHLVGGSYGRGARNTVGEHIASTPGAGTGQPPGFYRFELDTDHKGPGTLEYGVGAGDY